jgi:hypothetical protein
MTEPRSVTGNDQLRLTEIRGQVLDAHAQEVNDPERMHALAYRYADAWFSYTGSSIDREYLERAYQTNADSEYGPDEDASITTGLLLKDIKLCDIGLAATLERPYILESNIFCCIF